MTESFRDIAAAQWYRPQRLSSTITVIDGATSSSTSARPALPPPGPWWQDAIHGGLRFRVAPTRGHILAGHSLVNPLPETEAVDIFLDFSRRYWVQTDLEYTILPQRWPRIHGWVQEDVAAGATFPQGKVQTFIIETSAHSWPGATFSESPPPEEYTQPIQDRAEDRLINELETLFVSARGEIFEYGQDSDFGERLLRLLTTYELKCLHALETILMEGRDIPREAALEALAVVGSASIPSQSVRAAFLLRFLRHPSSVMRDAAGLALLDVGDQSVTGAIRETIERESNPQVRKNLLQAASELGNEQ
jgi:hypothetical protein